MVSAIKVPKKYAQKVHALILEFGVLRRGFKAGKKREFVVFPVEKLTPAQKSRLKKINKKIKFASFKFHPTKKKLPNIKEILRKKLTKAEMRKMIFSFDTVGDIAIVEIPKGLEKKEKLIGNAILQVNRSIKTVCKKVGIHSGIYRLQKVKVIAGEQRKTANYTEHGCRFKVSVDKVFFSVRLGTERGRIAKLIKKGEVVAGLFAGVGPFPIVFAKKSKMKIAYAVELNPFAYRQMLENIKLNKVGGKVTAIKGDVKKVVPKKLRGKCDRVVMPLPKGGESFLKEAIMCLKSKGGVVHFYQFVPADDPYSDAIAKIKKAAKKGDKKVKILRKSRVRSFSPSTIQVVIDAKVIF